MERHYSYPLTLVDCELQARTGTGPDWMCLMGDVTAQPPANTLLTNVFVCLQAETDLSQEEIFDVLTTLSFSLPNNLNFE